MIDFRYHLVSLISVFLALAVGIALGAGPLKETIGDSLTGQVDQLRVEKEALRAELDARSAELTTSENALAAVAPDLLDGVLGDRRVAVIELADVEADVLDQVVGRLDEAGATVTGTVQIAEGWTDPDQRTFRQTLAGTVIDYLDPVPAEDVGAGAELAEALAQALTSAAPEDPDALGENAGLILELLTEGSLITVDGEITRAADAVVILVGPTVSLADVEEATQEAASQPPAEAAANEALVEAQLAAAVELSHAAQLRSAGTVVAGGPVAGSGLLSLLRQDDTVADSITTVESVHTLNGQISVPLALSARIAGRVGHYGSSAEATAPMPPRVVLPTIQRVPVPVEPPVTEGEVDGTTTDDSAGAQDGAPAEDGAGTDGGVDADVTEGSDQG